MHSASYSPGLKAFVCTLAALNNRNLKILLDLHTITLEKDDSHHREYWLVFFWLTCIVTILGNGWRVLAPPSMAMPKVLALFITLTRVEVGSNSPG